MSYDFTMFTLEPNADLHTTLSARERTNNPILFNKESKQLAQALANALRFKNPKMDWRPVAMANIELIEVDAGENGDGIQISLFPNEAGLTVPYWHQGQKAHEVFLQIWDYLKTIQQLTNFAIYDPQLGRILHLEVDFDNVLSTYLGAMDKVKDIASQLENPQFGLSVNIPLSSFRGNDTPHVSLILFHDPGMTLNDAARLLKDDHFTVEDKGYALQVQWDDSPLLTIRLSRGKSVQEMAAEIGKDTPYAQQLGKCDACFGIFFEDLDEVLDEINTLIETQLTLQSATNGFLYNSWNESLTPNE